MRIFFESWNIHQVRADSLPDISSHLREDVEAAIIHIGPEIDDGCFRNELKQAANRWGRVAHQADDSVLIIICAPVADVLIERCQIFDAEHRVSMDGYRLDGVYLRGRKPNRRGESAQ